MRNKTTSYSLASVSLLFLLVPLLILLPLIVLRPLGHVTAASVPELVSDVVATPSDSQHDVEAADDSGWLLILPEHAPRYEGSGQVLTSEMTPPSWHKAWEAVNPLLAELQAQNLMGEVTELPEQNMLHVAWLSAQARQSLADFGVTIMPDAEANREPLRLASDEGACEPSRETLEAIRAFEGEPSFVIDVTQDYIEGVVEPGAAITVTLRTHDNGIKGRKRAIASSYAPPSHHPTIPLSH